MPTSALLLQVINTNKDQDTWTMCTAMRAPKFKMDLGNPSEASLLSVAGVSGNSEQEVL